MTWPVYGTWLPGPARGWIDPGSIQRDEPLPEPDPDVSGKRRRSLTWPAVSLDEPQRIALVSEAMRISALRYFELHAMAFAADHAHLRLSFRQRDVQRLVQLTKGALSRRLTVLAGDRPAQSARHESLAHHKWWARQYSFRRIDSAAVLEAVRERLRRHPDPVSIWKAPGGDVS